MSDMSINRKKQLADNGMLLDVTESKRSASQVLNWLLTAWEIDDQRVIVLLAERGRGDRLVKTVRVKLSNARRQLKNAGHKFTQFGFHADIKVWLDLTSGAKDVITLTRVVHMRHRLTEVLDDNDQVLNALLEKEI